MVELTDAERGRIIMAETNLMEKVENDLRLQANRLEAFRCLQSFGVTLTSKPDGAVYAGLWYPWSSIVAAMDAGICETLKRLALSPQEPGIYLLAYLDEFEPPRQLIRRHAGHLFDGLEDGQPVRV